MQDLFDLMNEPKIDDAELERQIDEMDGITSEFDRARKYNAFAQCNGCSGWTHIKGSRETMGNVTKGVACEHCGIHNFDQQSVISERTYNSALAKKRRPKGLKKK